MTSTAADTTHSRIPTDDHARHIAQRFFNASVTQVHRFSLGGSNYVYAVTSETGKRIVVRIAVDAGKFAGSLYWYAKLKAVSIPLPGLLAVETHPAQGGFPYLILERVAGRDLVHEYPALSTAEKQALAEEMFALHARVGSLPQAPGYGYARSYKDHTLHSAWIDVLHAGLERSRRRITDSGVADVRSVDRVAEKLATYRSYFARVQPVAFLDDTSTMNVIVANGKLQAIIDVDFVCFGDTLLTPALTRMALLSAHLDTIYSDHWFACHHPDAEQRRVFAFYTAWFCVDFIGEIGQRFHREASPQFDPAYLAHLTTLLDAFLQAC